MFSFLSKLIATIFSPVLSKKKTPSSQRPDSQVFSANKASHSAESETANDLQREIRQGREFSLAEAIGREGGSFIKGEFTIPRPLRATNAIKQFIDHHLTDSSSAFATTLFTWASTDIRVSRQLDTPLIALTQILDSLLNEPTTFYEFARQVAIAHSAITGDRPHFQQPNQPPHPEADYTHSSIRAQLSNSLQALNQKHP